MKRRNFIITSSILSAGSVLLNNSLLAQSQKAAIEAKELFKIFNDPATIYRPFVRWWWNGDKVERNEIVRELKLLKEAGIGGVEINPIKFPARTDDMGVATLRWLSPEWIDILDFTLKEAKKMGMICDLIVGSGWPFGAEYLEGDERADIMTIGVKKVTGMMDYEAPLFDFLKEADAATTSPYPQRELQIQKVLMVPDPMSSVDEIVDLSEQIPSGFIKTKIPKGNYAIYALVKTKAFLQVINGAPGADGQVLNHFNKAAVTKYLNHMTDTIQKRIGPLKGRVRALFTDSMELEGANWANDMADEFKKRRGYDLMPYLPFILFKIGGMGNVFDYTYPVSYTSSFQNIIDRVRFDFDLTKTELHRERFIEVFQKWCKANGMQSRVQSYGRGYHPLEGSFNMDIPEGETWIKYGVGKGLSETDYRVGRAYSMSNKYVSSAAHLQGKRAISCEELTNTDMVFNATLQMLKLGSDQSVISGITHSVYHGFNYSPPDAPFPGWIRYGNFMNEKNTYWPFFKYFNEYRARVSALLQQGDMYADIAILPPIYDMWSKLGAQNEPFPSIMYPEWLHQVWEAIQQNGNGCDYVSDNVIRDAQMKNGAMHYGPRKYNTIFIVSVESLASETAQKLLQFVESGGRIFCIQHVPHKSLGLKDFEKKDQQIEELVAKMKTVPGKFIMLGKPSGDFYNWYKTINKEYNLNPYLQIDNGNSSISQVRYQAGKTEILMVNNCSYDDTYQVSLRPHASLTKGKKAWIWDAVHGEYYSIADASSVPLNLYPADMKILVISNDKSLKSATAFKDVKAIPGNAENLRTNWQVIFKHIDGSTKNENWNELKDLKDIPQHVAFSGALHYKTKFQNEPASNFSLVDLGVVHGISQLFINGRNAGTRWFGRHVYDIKKDLKQGDNEIEIIITTVMGNYMKTLTDNPVAQYWTNEKRKNQPIQSMGLIGPVYIF